MRMNVLALLLIAAVTTGGCNTYKGLATPRSNLAFVSDADGADRHEKLGAAATDTEIANLLDVNVRPQLPARMAVVRLAASQAGYSPDLVAIDSAEMDGWSRAVAGQDKIKGVWPVSQLAHPNGPVTLRNLRLAAARMDCELLLAYIQADSSVDNRNYASVLYWTIVGLWVSPGNSLEHKTIMQAAIIDCRTGMILGTATGDSHLKRICPYAFTDGRQALMALEAPKGALTSLQKNAATMIRSALGEAL